MKYIILIALLMLGGCSVDTPKDEQATLIGTDGETLDINTTAETATLVGTDGEALVEVNTATVAEVNTTVVYDMWEYLLAEDETKVFDAFVFDFDDVLTASYYNDDTTIEKRNEDNGTLLSTKFSGALEYSKFDDLVIKDPQNTLNSRVLYTRFVSKDDKVFGNCIVLEERDEYLAIGNYKYANALVLTCDNLLDAQIRVYTKAHGLVAVYKRTASQYVMINYKK